MTKEEFAFWEKAFLASLSGTDSTQYVGISRGAAEVADSALEIWKEERTGAKEDS